MFLRKYFPHQLLVCHGPLRRFSSLLDVDELRDVEAAARACRTRVRVWSRGVDVHVDGVEAMDCYRAGMTLYMSSIGRFIPAVDRLVRSVAADLDIRFEQCGADLIASRAGAGAPMHFDSDDGFNIQIKGRKRWRTAPNRWVAHPLVSYGVGYTPPDRCPIGCRPTAGFTTCGRVRPCISPGGPGTRPRRSAARRASRWS